MATPVDILKNCVVSSTSIELLVKLSDEAKAELALVHNAILRMKQGHYGHCESCEEIINPQRLLALPYTTTCINCAT